MKATRSREQLLAAGIAWVEDFDDRTVKFIGTLEILGALGLVLPWLTDIAPVLTPIAATGLAVQMLLAARVHARRGDPAMAFAVVGVLFALNVFVAIGRFADL